MILLPHGKIKDHFSTMINKKIVFLADRKVKLLFTMFCLKPTVEAALILTIYSCGRKVGSGKASLAKGLFDSCDLSRNERTGSVP